MGHAAPISLGLVDLPNTTDPDYWQRISGTKGERIVYIRAQVTGNSSSASRAIDTERDVLCFIRRRLTAAGRFPLHEGPVPHDMLSNAAQSPHCQRRGGPECPRRLRPESESWVRARLA